MKTKHILRVLIIVALLLLIPVLGNRYVDGWNWTLFDFIWAAVVLSSAGLAFEFVTSRSGALMYKVAGGLAVITALVLVWINAAVSIIGDENPANILYGVVLLTLILGAIIVRFKSHGMFRVLFVTAIVQALVPVIGYFIWSPEVFSWAPGVVDVFILNGFFVMLFAASALLFRQADTTSK